MQHLWRYDRVLVMEGLVIRCKTTRTRLHPRDGKVFDSSGNEIEFYDGRWQVVINGNRSGWWRFNDHYDRDGYCDNPARGY